MASSEEWGTQDPPSKDIFYHNHNWETNRKRCPLFLAMIYKEVDPSWPETNADGNDDAIIEKIVRLRTMHNLRIFCENNGPGTSQYLWENVASVRAHGYTEGDILTALPPENFFNPTYMLPFMEILALVQHPDTSFDNLVLIFGIFAQRISPGINQDIVQAANGIDTIIFLMTKYFLDEDIQASGCRALGALVEDEHTSNKIYIFKHMGLVTILSAIREHKNSKKVQESGCFAIGCFTFFCVPLSSSLYYLP